MKVKIRENSTIARIAAWKLGTPTMAITFGNTIYLHNTKRVDFLDNTGWVCHELAHVYQYQRHGKLTFILSYLWESLRKGYYRNKWEVEARAAEQDTSLAEHIEFC